VLGRRAQVLDAPLGIDDHDAVVHTHTAQLLSATHAASDDEVAHARNCPTEAHVAFADVLEFDFIGLDRTSALQRFLSDKAERVGRRLKLRVQLRSFDAVCRFVECNVGIGIVPATTAERHANTMSIRRIELTDDWALRNLMICVRREADLPIYARDLVRHLSASQPPSPQVKLR